MVDAIAKLYLLQLYLTLMAIVWHVEYTAKNLYVCLRRAKASTYYDNLLLLTYRNRHVRLDDNGHLPYHQLILINCIFSILSRKRTLLICFQITNCALIKSVQDSVTALFTWSVFQVMYCC